MAWVKRNLGLVIGGAIALVLMGVAGYFLWTKYQADEAITAQLEETTQKFQTLLKRPLHPGTEGGKINNIELAKEENKRLQRFLEEVRGKFGKREIPTNISNRDFRALLDNTIGELQRKAHDFGIALPDKDYWFTFAPERSATEFKQIEMLTHQLWDVKDLCEILYDAKVPDLKGIRRVPASSEDNNGTDFISGKKASTNEYAVVTPYEVRFQGFSSELARVLERLTAAKHCFIVRDVAIDRASSDDANASMPPPVMNPYMMRYFNPRMLQSMQQQQQPTAPQPRRPGNVLLDENKLLIVLQIDAVRLKEPPPPKAAPVRGEQPKQVAQAQAAAQ